MTRTVSRTVQTETSPHNIQAGDAYQQPSPATEAPSPPSKPGFGSWLAKRILARLLKAVGEPSGTWVLWTGEEIKTGADPARFRISVTDQKTFWKVMADPYFQFAEAYADERMHVEGDLFEFLQMLNRTYYRYKRSDDVGGLLAMVPHPPRRNTLKGSRDNIHHHYDIGNDFYRLWLDEQLAYTCAYFPDSLYSLEQAQVAKMDHVSRKVWLRPGETVFEAGCGWGALALHMARHYGVKVKACNISREQIEYAKCRARDEGLDDRVEFIEDDWRNLSGRCDAFVSVGMLEHVGVDNYRALGDVIHRCLNGNGRGLIHTIGQVKSRPSDRWIERRIFPGAYPPALSEMMKIFEPREYSVLDVENLRLHYAETLRHWLERFEQSLDEVRGMFDERFVRMWRLYLAGSCSGFSTGGLQLFQVVFAPGKQTAIPRSRRHQYSDELPGREQFFSSPDEGSNWWNDVTS